MFLDLLKHGPWVDITDAYGKTPLSAAASNMTRGRDELIKDLVLRSHEQAYHVSFKNTYCVETLF